MDEPETTFRLGPFDLSEILGRGAMAVVWRGVHRAQGVPVAVKVITDRVAKKPRYREAFSREVQSMARLHHPGVVLVLDHGEVSKSDAKASENKLSAGCPYMAMELSSWGSLTGLKLPLRFHDLMRLLRPLLDALAHAHARGVIHRDLKPGNILMSAPWDSRPGLKLTDFGIAHALETEGIDDRDAASGTPPFMAPEQLMGRWRDYGPWTDLYAVGCIAFRLATGELPFPGDNLPQIAMKHLSAAPPRFPEDSPLPLELEGWVHRLLQKRPQDRFQKAADAAYALGRIDERMRRKRGEGPVPGGVIEEETTRLERSELPSDDPATEISLGAAVPGDFSPEAPKTGIATMAEAGAEILPWSAWQDESQELMSRSLPVNESVTLCRRRIPPLPEAWSRAGEEEASGMSLVGAGLALWGLRSIRVVGREEERDALWSEVHEVRDTHCSRAVVLHGAAGHGKSRLVEWIAERADEVGSAWVFKATHDLRPGPSHGLSRLVAKDLRAIGLDRKDIEAHVQEKLRAEGIDDEYESLALAEAISPTNADGEGGVRFSHARERHAVIRRLLERKAQDRPVIVWLEDVQWGDDAIDFVRRALRADRKRPHPILFLLTIRDEAMAEAPAATKALASLKKSRAVTTLPVKPLSEENHRKLVQELLRLDEQLAEQVAQRTQGNPLFAIQLVGDWVERGVLEVGEHGFVVPPGEDAALPDDIHQVWMRRLEASLKGMPPSAGTALEIAALLGSTVDAQEWALACKALGVPVPPLLIITLTDHRLASPADGGWSFSHGMLRESLERHARDQGRAASLHSAIASMLLRCYDHGTPGVAARVGHHWLMADEPELALDPIRRGALERMEVSDFSGALELVDRHNDALNANRTAATDPRFGGNWVLRARLNTLRGNFEAATTWAERAVDAAERHKWRHVLPDAILARARAAFECGDHDLAQRGFSRARALYLALNDDRGAGRTLVGEGDSWLRTGDLQRAEALLFEGIETLDGLDDPVALGHGLLALGHVALTRGDAEGAYALFMQQLEMQERLGNRFQVARSIGALGELARHRGHLDDAETCYRRSLAIHEGIGSRLTWMSKLNLGLVLLARGEYEAAHQLVEDVTKELGDAAEPSQRCLLLIQQLPSTAERGRAPVWDRQFEDGARLLQDTGLHDSDAAWLLALAAERAVAQGWHERAKAAFQLSIKQWEALGRQDQVDEVEQKKDALLASE